VAQTIFSTLTITFALLAGGNYSHACKLAAGYFGIFCGSSAIYAALAMLYQVRCMLCIFLSPGCH
jgi:hypothetical protein